MKKYALFLINVISVSDWLQNYYATRYSAEIVNTMTNLLFLYLGLKGLFNCIKHKHDSIFTISYLGYLLVGFGSFCFHSTLKCRNSSRSIEIDSKSL